MLPLSLIFGAADALRQEAIRNHRLRPETRLEMLLNADALPARWLGGVLLQRAIAEKQE